MAPRYTASISEEERRLLHELADCRVEELWLERKFPPEPGRRHDRPGFLQFEGVFLKGAKDLLIFSRSVTMGDRYEEFVPGVMKPNAAFIASAKWEVAARAGSNTKMALEARAAFSAPREVAIITAKSLLTKPGGEAVSEHVYPCGVLVSCEDGQQQLLTLTHRASSYVLEISDSIGDIERELRGYEVDSSF